MTAALAIQPIQPIESGTGWNHRVWDLFNTDFFIECGNGAVDDEVDEVLQRKPVEYAGYIGQTKLAGCEGDWCEIKDTKTQQVQQVNSRIQSNDQIINWRRSKDECESRKDRSNHPNHSNISNRSNHPHHSNEKRVQFSPTYQLHGFPRVPHQSTLSYNSLDYKEFTNDALFAAETIQACIQDCTNCTSCSSSADEGGWNNVELVLAQHDICPEEIIGIENLVCRTDWKRVHRAAVLEEQYQQQFQRECGEKGLNNPQLIAETSRCHSKASAEIAQCRAAYVMEVAAQIFASKDENNELKDDLFDDSDPSLFSGFDECGWLPWQESVEEEDEYDTKYDNKYDNKYNNKYDKFDKFDKYDKLGAFQFAHPPAGQKKGGQLNYSLQ